jgi:hypothetical protein
MKAKNLEGDVSVGGRINIDVDLKAIEIGDVEWTRVAQNIV